MMRMMSWRGRGGRFVDERIGIVRHWNTDRAKTDGPPRGSASVFMHCPALQRGVADSPATLIPGGLQPAIRQGAEAPEEIIEGGARYPGAEAPGNGWFQELSEPRSDVRKLIRMYVASIP